MYKLFIADDEAFIRSGLQSIIEWEVYGIEIAGEAEDGMKAYLAIKSLQPDLALIDISMPNMTGLELMELCSHLEHPPKFIILSGYNDFQYVQKAMQLGAINYLLKPVNQEELIQTAISSVKLLDSLSEQQQQFQESMETLRNNVLLRVLHNRIEPRELREKCQVVDISLHCSHMRVGILKLLDASVSSMHPFYPAVRLCSGICASLCPCYTIADIEDNIAVIFKDQACLLKEEDYLSTLSSCSEAIFNELKLRSVYSLGTEANHVQELARSYDNGISKLEKMLILGTSIEQQVAAERSFPSISYPDFLRYLEAGDTVHTQELIHTYFSEILAYDTNLNMDILKYHLIEFVTYILHSKYMVSFSEAELALKKQTAFSIISETDSLLLLEEKLNLFLLSLIEHTAENTGDTSYSFLVQNALTYVNTNYTDSNLSLKTLAADMEVNAAYLGREFARETGEFFNDYLNRIRIAKAMHLLTTTTWKTAKIANSVGFMNISYFFTLFKKITGQSPGDYRTTH